LLPLLEVGRNQGKVGKRKLKKGQKNRGKKWMLTSRARGVLVKLSFRIITAGSRAAGMGGVGCSNQKKRPQMPSEVV